MQGQQLTANKMGLWQVNLFLLVCHVVQADFGERCAKTTTLRNGQVRFQSRGGVTAVFTCSPGYVLRGANVSHCQTDGHWSAPAPSCVSQGQRVVSSEIEKVSIHPGQYTEIRCSLQKPDKEANEQLFWTAHGISVKNTFSKDGTVVLSTNRQGTYICLAHNKTAVSVLRAVKIEYSLASSKAQSNSCNIIFKDTTISISAASGSLVTISCDVASSTVNISWLKNGAIISDKNISHLNTHLNFHLTPEREGNYTCLVNDSINNDCSRSKTVIVKLQNPIYALPTFSCGKPVIRRTKRIIDGSRALPQSAPWMCMLSLDREPPFCGCSLISSRWIITAAHCFKKSDQGIPKLMPHEEIRKKIRVKFGKQQRRQVEKGEIIRGIISMVAYPKYKPDSSNQNIASEHDIALAKLDVPVIFQSNILPICLPPPGFTDSVPSGALGIVTGWGRVSVRDSVMALTLQEAYLPVVNSSSCQQSTDYVITDNMLCAGFAESYKPDTCFGDSGGPYILQQHSSWFIAGIVSWGEGCSSPKKFGIYTKVEKYVTWIQSTWEKDLNK